MTQEQHPITPPELVQQWASDSPIQANDENWAYELYIAHQAARWGADQELNECCHLLRLQGFDVVDDLRAARRPKPPSLKEQALEALAQVHHAIEQPIAITIRRALEALPDD